MTKSEVMELLRSRRALFDAKVAAVPRDALDEPIPRSTKTVKEIVAHVSNYEQLIVDRLISAGHGAGTALRHDQLGFGRGNDLDWPDVTTRAPEQVLRRAADVFDALMQTVGDLSDDELNEAIGATAALDKEWLQGRAPWEMIAIDAYDHYPMHFPALDAAIERATLARLG